MLRSIIDLEDYRLQTAAGNIGRLKDFTFDDKAWVIRYLVVDIGAWPKKHLVLISPIALGAPNWLAKTIPVLLSKSQIQNSPPFDPQKPITKQHEIEHLSYYNYPYYWGGPSLWGKDIYPNRFSTGSGGFNAPPFELRVPEPPDMEDETHAEHELHGGFDTMGIRVTSGDVDIGLVKDLLIDEDSWAIRYMVVNTGDWWPNQQVLIAPQWIGALNWVSKTISIQMSQAEVKTAPHCDPSVTIDRDLELALHAHYRQPGYWTVEVSHADEVHSF